VPTLLLLLGTVPGHLPTLAGVRQALLSQDDSGTGLVATMTLAAWAAWLWLAIPVVIEVVAVAGRRTTPRLPGMATGQRLAGYLVASLLLAAPAATAASASTPAPGQTATAPHAPLTSPSSSSDAGSPSAAASQSSTAQAAPSSAQASAVAEYIVGAGGITWWELAEQLLGDGARYQDLRALNPDVPGGLSVLPEGTTVSVPASNAPGGEAEAAVEPAAFTQTLAADTAPKQAGVDKGHKHSTYTVRPGDSLSKIAQRQLGDAAQWPDLYAASKNRSQPEGLPRITDPDVIHPGQTISLPHAAPSGDPGNGSDGDGDKQELPHKKPAPPEQERHDPPARSGGHPGDEAASTPPPSTDRANSGAHRPSPPPSAETHDTSQPHRSSNPSSVEPAGSSSRETEVRTTLGAFALLAAAVTGALGTRRLLQRRRRKVGETIAIGESPSPAAAQLAQLAEPPIAPRLDRALRTLASNATEAGQSLPDLRVARLSQKTVLVLPADEECTPLSPFVAGEEGWWLLPDEAELLAGGQAREVAAPYPAFVTIGTDEATGDLILINLAAERVVLLDGSAEDLRQVCRSVVLELAMSEWADRLEIITVGFGEELTQLLPTMRVGHKREAAHAVRDLVDWLVAAVQLPDDADQPYLLVCASSLDADSAWQIAEALDKAGNLPALLIAPSNHTARHFGEAQILDASARTAQQLDGTGVSIVLQRIDDGAYQQITTDLQISGQPPISADGAWRNVPEEPNVTEEPEDVTRGTPPSSPSLAPAAPAQNCDSPSADPRPAPTLGPTDPGEQREATPSNPASAGAATRAEEASSPSAAPPAVANVVRNSNGDDPSAPLLSVLGTVQISGDIGSSLGPREAQLAALLHFKPGRSADTLCADMDPLTPWTKRTLNTRMGDLRRALGDDPQGNPYVPRRTSSDDPYVLSARVRCDWDEFKDLAERALCRGPADVAVLETALGMVRGRPFGSHPLPWAEPHSQEMITRIIDIAHTVAQWRTARGPERDLVAARQAVSVGLEVDSSAELLYRDWFRIEHASGNRSGLHAAIARLQQVNRSIDASLEIETLHLIQTLLGSSAELADAV
jgi:nucleoid-associated protein YgaU